MGASTDLDAVMDTRLKVLIGTIGFSATVAASYGFTQIFGGCRAALIHTGALEAAWMIGNVAFETIPPSTVQ
jgi:uncharacterized membrane protein